MRVMVGHCGCRPHGHSCTHTEDFETSQNTPSPLGAPEAETTTPVTLEFLMPGHSENLGIPTQGTKVSPPAPRPDLGFAPRLQNISNWLNPPPAGHGPDQSR
jgi:hypothetical protein